MKDKHVFIEVTEFRAISSDSKQWMLMRRNPKVDKETKKAVGGYTEWLGYSFSGSFEVSAATLERELQRTCGARTFTELRRMSERIHAMMLEMLDVAKLPSISK